MSILLLDSGVGGLTVLKVLRAALPRQRYIFVADNAAFPYGAWDEDALRNHIVALFHRLVAEYSPDLAVIACNTASTLVLPALRGTFAIPFVGTVPAIKPAAEATKSGLVSVLATPGTVKRDYTKALIRDFANGCEVTLVGCTALAGIAEAKLSGGKVDADALAAEIAPAFVEKGDKRTDTIVLGCTHYPLLLDELAEVAPWKVDFIDPAPAIARRVRQVLPESIPSGGGGDVAHFTDGGNLSEDLLRVMAQFRLKIGQADM